MSPTAGLARRASRRLLAGLAAVAAVTAVLAASVLGAGVGNAALPTPGWSATATSATTDLADGAPVAVTIKANPEVTVFDVEIRECKAGATYSTRDDVLPPAGKCPDRPVSSTADQVVVRSGDALNSAVHTDTGASLSFKAGVGTIEFGGGEFSCNQATPCVLVVQVHLAGHYEYATIPLSFIDDAIESACGGPAKGVLTTGGSDQMQDAWSGWTKDLCTKPGASGAATRAAFPGEGSAVQSFASGNFDLAYTAAAYDTDVGLLGRATSARAAVATPVALNAAVVAVGGGYLDAAGAKKPYPEIKMTAAEVAALFGGGLPWVLREDLPYQKSILDRNPILSGFLTAQIPLNKPMLPSEAESSTWFATNLLTKQVPTHWISPSDGKAPRGPVVSAATATPPFPFDDTFSGRPVLAKVTDAAHAAVSTQGPVWALTDLATARALGMTPVSIQNADGDFVAPTPESMQAAVATMKPDDLGILLPDPAAKGSADVAAAAVTPYPLTYVEYALAPTEPLLDTATCTTRPESQALLTSWLQYVTGDGQKVLPAGLAPLTPDLVVQAAARIPQVGTAASTGPCTGKVTPPAAGGRSSGASVGGIPTGSIPSSFSTLGGNASVAVAAAPTTADTPKETDAIAIPAFAGHKLVDTDGSVIALIGIVLITSLAAWLTAGKPRVAALAGAGGGSNSAPTRSNVGGLAMLWAGVAVAGIGLVVYQLGPLLQQREQRDLMSEYRTEVRHAANAGSGLQTGAAVTKAPADGDPVGVLEIGSLQTQSVVVEGVTPTETRKGPGHVPGTAGLGQPGNAAVVARRNGYGGTFADLSNTRKGDRILVTTTQGQTVYVVRTVKTESISDPTDASSSSSASTSGTGASSSGSHDASIPVDDLYGPSKDDRLTLVTSASRTPWNTSDAIVVTAKMQGKPFEPTPQNGRSDSETGRNAESGVWASVTLSVLLYAGAVSAAILLYRKMRFRIAYILTIAPLVALTVITGETLSRLLPAWM